MIYFCLYILRILRIVWSSLHTLQQKEARTSIQPQAAANDEASYHVQEEQTVGNLQMVLHEQGPIVVEEQEW
jgi:hypothetical protein